MPRNGIAGSQGHSMLYFLRDCQTVFQSVYTILCCFFTALPMLTLFCVFDNGHSSGYKVVSHRFVLCFTNDLIDMAGNQCEDLLTMQRVFFFLFMWFWPFMYLWIFKVICTLLIGLFIVSEFSEFFIYPIKPLSDTCQIKQHEDFLLYLLRVLQFQLLNLDH